MSVRKLSRVAGMFPRVSPNFLECPQRFLSPQKLFKIATFGSNFLTFSREIFPDDRHFLDCNAWLLARSF